jgi:two-component system phosphate regulon sensor histidine kinase PhoR
MIRPLAERSRQVETLHHVNQEIVGQPQLLKVLDEIAKRAIEWVNGDAGGVFLLQGDQLVFAVAHNMPESYLGLHLPVEHGVAGQTVRTGRSQYIEAYHIDWKGVPDFPHAKLAFGSVIAVPITSKDVTYGVLIAVTGKQGRLLRRDDVYRLELLAPQAALTLGYASLLDIKTALAEKIEESRLQLETLLFSTESPVIAIDRKMHLIFANPAAYEVIGLGESVVGDNITTKLPLHLFMDDWREIVRGLNRDNSVIFEVTLGKRIYQCHLARLGRLKMGGWVAVLNDVTQLKELDRMKGEMIRMVSHDLKNPLMSAMLQIDLMRYRNHDHPDDTIDQMERQLERMDRIIRGVLDVERLRSGSLKLSPAYAGPIVEKAVDDLRRLAQDSGVEVSHEVDHTAAILCDEAQAERAVSNLVENAIKFTPRGGSVTVRMAVQEEHVIVMVRDSGIGIPADIQPLVFQRFFRGRQKGFEYATGTGLGLALVQAIMDSHQGHVWFESREGDGTVFYLRFKRANLPDEAFYDE